MPQRLCDWMVYCLNAPWELMEETKVELVSSQERDLMSERTEIQESLAGRTQGAGTLYLEKRETKDDEKTLVTPDAIASSHCDHMMTTQPIKRSLSLCSGSCGAAAPSLAPPSSLLLVQFSGAPPLGSARTGRVRGRQKLL